MRKFWWIALAGLPLYVALGTNSGLPFKKSFPLDGAWQQEWTLQEGAAFSVSVHIGNPATLPPNGRIAVRWTGPALPELAFNGERGDLHASATADWSKVLHALDPDVYLVYRAPKAGTYRLTIESLDETPEEKPVFEHDKGLAPLATPLPHKTPRVSGVALAVELAPLEETFHDGTLIEAEPNNTPEQAVRLPFAAGEGEQVIRVLGGADELEYFYNSRSGRSPDDWYRLDFRGSRPMILTANLQMAEPVVSARMRVYRPGTPPAEKASKPVSLREFGNASPVPYIHPPVEVIPGPEPVYTYYEGRDINERIHQQDDNFRSFVTRVLEPGGTYYLRVEANQPAYELELRIVEPAPYDDPKRAIEAAIRYHLAEVDAWLIHRPRHIAQHHRVRDGTSVLGENCMSCHTQSGVWGVADAFRNGYRPWDRVQNWRRLVNTMYESLRPTNKLEDAAANTSLAPLDLGDAPAGSRVAGRNIVLHERTAKPKALHRYQQRRTANYVLQTADPQGINAAGKGSNFGPNVVFKFSAEVLERAWRDTGEEKYFWGLEEKAKKIVGTGDWQIKVSDDLGHRIEFFHKIWPADYVETVQRLIGDSAKAAAAREFHAAFAAQVEIDLRRLLALQQKDGGWGFDLGTTPDKGQTWVRMDEEPDAAPTAVALLALQAAGRRPGDPAVDGGVRWLLANQFPYGLWNRAAQTGFVTTAYGIRALSQLFPKQAPELRLSDFQARRGESWIARAARVRHAQEWNDARLAPVFLEAAKDPHPQVRYYAYLGLSGGLAPEGIPALIGGLGDPVKACREAAFWALRQYLLDDQGWDAVAAVIETADSPVARQSAMQALFTRADLSGAGSRMRAERLGTLLARAMADPHPGVRVWARKAAWRWWIWNPGVRGPVNRAWAESLLRDEPNAHAEIALRYSTASLLMVNGHIANQTGEKNADQQYRELAEFYQLLDSRRAVAGSTERQRLERRLTAVAASHFQERGNDGGAGQMGYSTPGSADLMGKVVLSTYGGGAADGIPWDKIALEGAANVGYAPLQQTLLKLLETGDLENVAVAARALANPRTLSLPARPETLRSMLSKLERFLADGRKEDAQAMANFLGSVRWDFSGVSEEAEAEFYRALIPAGRPRASLPRGPAFRPAPEAAAAPDRAELLGQILGGNPTLQRKVVFQHLEGEPRFWLPSTEWMITFQEGRLSEEQAIEGAVEAEDLKVLDLTAGRTTEQIVPDGLASKNSILWWREAAPGARLTFAVEAPEAGRYNLIAAFLYDRELGTVRLSLNGQPVTEALDFYRRTLTPSGPVSLGVHEFVKGENRLTVEMLGSNPDAEPLYVFGIDYVKLAADEGSGSMFQQTRRGQLIRIDPIVEAKERVLDMFVEWFAPGTPEATREFAVNLANKTALRRNPKVRTALAAWVDREPERRLQDRIRNILNSDDSVYGKELAKLIEQQKETITGVEVRPLAATEDWIKDLLHFRDVVFTELGKLSPEDNRACLSCHGIPGRVPTLYLDPPDSAGYIPPEQLLTNYRRLQQRVDLDHLERSKLLTKPLNIQSGQEDGHQGGQRYQPSDAGYEVIRKWVERQAALQRQTAPL
ncbi:MAG: HEAT repeat domain-containing protein [Bryobacterales bacterium]|nr:HEAT repeat domain-containing protein [Bryobacterales bacterium]